MNTLAFKNASPATQEAYNGLVAAIAAVPASVSAIVSLGYVGAVAGSEFETYAATKVYFCLEIDWIGHVAGGATIPSVQYYNLANVLWGRYHPIGLVWWTGAAVNYDGSPLMTNQNLWFSKIIAGVYTHLKFIGYKITFA
jgi:hypothetical protein